MSSTSDAPPKVSVVTITYNHERYVRDAIDGVLAQRTDFPIELIVADDASTDNTAAIVAEYAARDPDRVIPVLRAQNIGIALNAIDALCRARGEYVALCEGDDYWTDPDKLARQVAMLDADPGMAMCFHRARVVHEDGSADDQLPGSGVVGPWSFDFLLGTNTLPTQSVMYRRQDYASVPDDIFPLDWYLHLYHAKNGSVGFIDKVMSVYRRHEGGAWRDATHDPGAHIRRNGLAQLTMYHAMRDLVAGHPDRTRIVDDHLIAMLKLLAQSDLADSSDQVVEALRRFPDLGSVLARELVYRDGIIERDRAELARMSAEMTDLPAAHERLHLAHVQLQTESALQARRRKRQHEEIRELRISLAQVRRERDDALATLKRSPLLWPLAIGRMAAQLFSGRSSGT
jgi:glycosyltransferase involved in cell wall biosynthesis